MSQPIEVIALTDDGGMLFCDLVGGQWQVVIQASCRVVKMLANYERGISLIVPIGPTGGAGAVVGAGMTLTLDFGSIEVHV